MEDGPGIEQPSVLPSIQNYATMLSESEQEVIWGTTINVSDATNTFRSFIHTFKDPNSPSSSSSNTPLYLSLLRRLTIIDGTCLNIDCGHLLSFDKTFYEQLVSYPQEIIPLMDSVVSEASESILLDSGQQIDPAEERRTVQVRTYNLEKMEAMRDLSPTDIDRLVCLRGMIIRTSHIIPDLKQAFFQCQVFFFFYYYSSILLN